MLRYPTKVSEQVSGQIPQVLQVPEPQYLIRDTSGKCAVSSNMMMPILCPARMAAFSLEPVWNGWGSSEAIRMKLFLPC